MIKKPFFSLGRPQLKYPTAGQNGTLKLSDLSIPAVARLYAPIGNEGSPLLIKEGDEVNTGQRLLLREGEKDYVISTVTGTIRSVEKSTGFMDSAVLSITVDVSKEDTIDGEFKAKSDMNTRERVLSYLGAVPGTSSLSDLIEARPEIETLLVYGTDRDLLVTTNRMVSKMSMDLIGRGLAYLREILSIKKTLLVLPEEIEDAAVNMDADIFHVKGNYPSSLPRLVIKSALGRVLPRDRELAEMGIRVINAEAVAAVASALDQGIMPVDKMITLIDKKGNTSNVRVRLGTTVGEILKAFNIDARDGDRIVLGGPMRGSSIYSLDAGIWTDTDAIMVQDGSQIAWNSDSHCINCGECVRACPVDVPVNMLVRLLENGLYEEAARDYDLLSCVECGLCSYVCVARIPIFHYIMLGKHEIAQIRNQEEANE